MRELAGLKEYIFNNGSKALILPFVLFGIITACSNEVGALYQKKNNTDTISIISDANFKNGIGLQGVSSAHPEIEEILYPFGKSASDPSWLLAQWGSRFDLYNDGDVAQKEDNGSITYSNEAKRINFWHTDGSTQVSLEMVGSKEYTSPRKADDINFPGLLLGQDLKHKIFLKRAIALNLKIDARLMYAVNKMGSAYNKNIHTASYALNFTFSNLNSSSKGFGDYIWFGLPFYDYRLENIPSTGMKDGGTGKIIYVVAGKDLYKGSFHDKQWKHISVNLLPYVKKAYQEAKKKGYLKNTDFNDLAISSMNIGWELPGTFDVGMEFKDLSLGAIVKR